MIKMMSPIMIFEHDDDQKRGVFFLNNAQGKRIAEITYIWSNPQTIIANHTWVDDSLRGQGVAKKLLDTLVQFARDQQLKIIATCSYVDVIFKRDPSFADVMA